MMKGFVDEVPREYEDAAMLDGYSRFEAFWRVTMPLLIPGIAATAVFALIFSWNEFVFSIFLITDPGHAHGAVRDRGADRRHDDRLGPGRRARRWCSRSRCWCSPSWCASTWWPA